MFTSQIQCINKSKICTLKGLWSSFDNSRKIILKTIPNQVRQYHEITGDVIILGKVPGLDYLRDPRTNKDLAFTLEERQLFGIHGLMPGLFKTQDEQAKLCKIILDRYSKDINKYIYLSDLQDQNEHLFYRLLMEHIEELMPIVYTPTVGLACQTFGLIYRRPRGLFISIQDKGHIFNVIKNWPESHVRAICVTDGERILGLGDLGAYGMGIPIGKLSLYTGLAAIHPHQCLPILLDVGTNNQTLLEDPLYCGIRAPRVSGPEYDEFVDEFMEAVVKRYGQNTLIQFEDFGQGNAFKFLERYEGKYCTFNDDIQGTAAVCLGGLLASERITGIKLSQHTLCFAGAGGAALGIANLCVKQMVAEGLSLEEARKRIIMTDIDGLLTKKRQSTFEGHKVFYCADSEDLKDLHSIINKFKPTALLGATANPSLFNKEVLTTMAKNNERPIIFALSNPTSRAECSAEEAFNATEGRVIFSSGSPFPPVNYKGKTYVTGQGNNAYIFPGVALGVIATGSHHVPDDMFLIAARSLAECISQEELQQGTLFPTLKNIKEVSIKIAIDIVKYAYAKGLAAEYPEPQDKLAWLKTKLYSTEYKSLLPYTWPWKEPVPIKTKPIDSENIVDPKYTDDMAEVQKLIKT